MKDVSDLPLILSGAALLLNGLFMPLMTFILKGMREDQREANQNFMQHITDRAAHCKK